MAKIFPADAKKSAVKEGISLLSATTNAASDEKGRMVAARNADTKRASSAISTNHK